MKVIVKTQQLTKLIKSHIANQYLHSITTSNPHSQTVDPPVGNYFHSIFNWGTLQSSIGFPILPPNTIIFVMSRVPQVFTSPNHGPILSHFNLYFFLFKNGYQRVVLHGNLFFLEVGKIYRDISSSTWPSLSNSQC